MSYFDDSDTYKEIERYERLPAIAKADRRKRNQALGDCAVGASRARHTTLFAKAAQAGAEVDRMESHLESLREKLTNELRDTSDLEF